MSGLDQRQAVYVLVYQRKRHDELVRRQAGVLRTAEYTGLDSPAQLLLSTPRLSMVRHAVGGAPRTSPNRARVESIVFLNMSSAVALGSVSVEEQAASPKV
jgi:hypothetical protein